MKKLLLALGVITNIQVFAQVIPSTIGQVYNFCVGDSFEYSYSEIQGTVQCGITGVELHIITSYNIVGDTVIYSYKSLRSMNHFPCPNYGPPYGILFDSSSVTQQIPYADSSIFSPNLSIGVFTCQGLTYSQCHDSVYISTTGNFIGKKLNEYYYNDFSGTDDIWIDSLGLVDSYIGLEDNPPIEYRTNLIFYHKACAGERWSTFQPFPDYSIYAGIENLLNNIRINIYPNPVTSNLEVEINEISSFADNGTTKLSVQNLLGQQIFGQNLLSEKTEVDCGLWPRGIYIWSVWHEGAMVKSGKVVVE